MNPVEIQIRPKKGICAAKGCNKETKGGRQLCSTHSSQQTRLKDPVKYAFYCKRNRAKQRGIFWDLTLEQFKQFCHETEYMDKKGRVSGSFDLDRIVEGLTPGYTITNIQILEKVENIRKYKKYDKELKRAVEIVETIIKPEDLPF